MKTPICLHIGDSGRVKRDGRGWGCRGVMWIGWGVCGHGVGQKR
jgi:hypothetical protein